MAQLVDQALDKIKKTGIFTNSVTAWAARDPNDKDWQNLKAHFIAAYDAHLESGPVGSAKPTVNCWLSGSNKTSTRAHHELVQ